MGKVVLAIEGRLVIPKGSTLRIRIPDGDALAFEGDGVLEVRGTAEFPYIANTRKRRSRNAR